MISSVHCDAQERNQMQTRANAEIIVYSGKGHSQVVRDSQYNNHKQRMFKSKSENSIKQGTKGQAGIVKWNRAEVKNQESDKIWSNQSKEQGRLKKPKTKGVSIQESQINRRTGISALKIDQCSDGAWVYRLGYLYTGETNKLCGSRGVRRD